MAEGTATEAIVGGLTLALAVGFVVYAAQGTGLSAGAGGAYPLTASFRSAEGVAVGSDVRLAGVRIGTVSGLGLNRETFRADLTVAIEQGVSVPEDSAIAISSEGLLGGSFVEILPGGSPFNLAPGDEIVDTQGALSLLGLLAQFISTAGDE